MDTKIDSLLINADNIINDMVHIEQTLINTSITHSDMHNLTFNLKRKILTFNIKIQEIKLNTNVTSNNKYKLLSKKQDFINNNLTLILNLNNLISEKNRTRSIDRLSLINTIGIPLGIIVGYYGMNFKSMNRIFGAQYGQLHVLMLFIISIIIIYILFNKNII